MIPTRIQRIARAGGENGSSAGGEEDGRKFRAESRIGCDRVAAINRAVTLATNLAISDKRAETRVLTKRPKFAHDERNYRI